MAPGSTQGVNSSGMMIVMDIPPGDMIKNRRRSLKATQVQLAERAGVSVSVIGDLENNRRESFHTLAAVNAALDAMEAEATARSGPRAIEWPNLPPELVSTLAASGRVVAVEIDYEGDERVVKIRFRQTGDHN